jgi:multicomponent Na+:H+ antiporter subunit E
MSLLRVLRRLPRIAWYALYFLKELVVANARIAWEVLTPGFTMQAGIVRVPTDCHTEWEVMMLANSISLTPGTLTLEVDTATNDLFVHALYVRSREEFVEGIARMERYLLGAMRG